MHVIKLYSRSSGMRLYYHTPFLIWQDLYKYFKCKFDLKFNLNIYFIVTRLKILTLAVWVWTLIFTFK